MNQQIYDAMDQELARIKRLPAGGHPNWTHSWFCCAPLQVEYRVAVTYTDKHVMATFPINKHDLLQRSTPFSIHADDSAATRFVIIEAIIMGLQERSARIGVSL